MADELDFLGLENSPDKDADAPLVPAAQTEGRKIAAATLTDPLPPSAYAGAGTLSLTAEQEAVLEEPLSDDEVDIRPDGLIYASHEYCRRKLNQSFGHIRWALVPGSPIIRNNKRDQYGKEFAELYQRWVLLSRGVYVSEAMSSRAYFDNGNQSYDDVIEAIKSDCLRRVCKDIGIAHECWNRRFQDRWKSEYAVEVLIRGARGNYTRWRRRDAAPLKDEIAVSGASTPKAHDPVPSASSTLQLKPETGTQAAPTETPVPAETPSPQGNTVQPQSSPVTTVKAGAGPKITVGQARLLWVKARAAGLVTEDDARELGRYLLNKCGIAAPLNHQGKSATEIVTMMIRELPGGAKLQALFAELDRLAAERGSERVEPDDASPAPEPETEVII